MRRLNAVGRFLVVILLTYLGLLAVTFFIGRVIPVDPVLAIVGDNAPPHVVARVREEMGLNKPLWQQFYIYLRKVLQRRLRHLGADRQPGDAGHPPRLSGDAGAGQPGHPDRRRPRRAAGRVGGGAARQAGRPGGARHRADRLFGADLLARADGAAGVLRQAGLGRRAGAHRRGLRISRSTPVTGLLLLDTAMAGEWEAFRQCAVAPDPAGLAAGLFLAGLHQPHDALLHAQRTGAGIRRRRARQGPVARRASSGATRCATRWCRWSR